MTDPVTMEIWTTTDLRMKKDLTTIEVRMSTKDLTTMTDPTTLVYVTNPGPTMSTTAPHTTIMVSTTMTDHMMTTNPTLLKDSLNVDRSEFGTETEDWTIDRRTTDPTQRRIF